MGLAVRNGGGLSAGVGRFGARIGPRQPAWINRAAGSLLVVFSVASIAGALRP